MENSHFTPAVSETGDLLSMLQARARTGTLLSSCEPEVKELMYQLDIMISAKCRKWEEEVKRLSLLLRKKEMELETINDKLKENMAEMEHVIEAANKREREHQAYSADYEAQLVQLRSEVTHISLSYEQLKEKRYQGQKTRLRGVESTQVTELLKELEKSKLKLHVTREELQRAKQRVAELETNMSEYVNPSNKESWKLKHANPSKELVEDLLEKIGSEPAQCRSSHILKQFAINVDKIKEESEGEYIPLQPTERTYSPTQEASQFLQHILDQHFQQLNQELLKIFDA